MDTLLNTLDLIVRPAIFITLLGLFYVGVKIAQYEHKLNRIEQKLNNNPMPSDFEEEEFPLEDPEEIDGKKLHDYYDPVRGVWKENPFFDINDAYEYERHSNP